jgi:hypothetical protein
MNAYAETTSIGDSVRRDKSPIARLFCAWHDLRCEGWNPMLSAPTGIRVQLIEIGSTGIHEGYFDNGWWIEDGDLYPSHPVLWRHIP